MSVWQVRVEYSLCTLWKNKDFSTITFSCPAVRYNIYDLSTNCSKSSTLQRFYENNAQIQMDHTHIITAGQLHEYAERRDSQAVIPELIYLLVRQSVPAMQICRIPYGDAVNQPGCDGLVEVDSAFLEFVPKGRSYWEIGTGCDPKVKATSDFKKRTDAMVSADKSEATFVFVTPRSSGSDGWNEPDQEKWLGCAVQQM